MRATRRTFLGGVAGGIAMSAVGGSASWAAGASGPALTNLAHLNFLRDRVTPPATPRHTTYLLSSSPSIDALWSSAAREEDGSYTRHGGEGAYRADDLAGAVVVYLRDWRLTGARESRRAAYEVARGLTFMQVASGPAAGSVVPWMQPDGTLDPGRPAGRYLDPSDDGVLTQVGPTLWALGEAVEAFSSSDPPFAGFLRARLELSLRAVERQLPLPSCGLGGDAAASALLGLAAYRRAGGSGLADRVRRELTKGIAAAAARRSHGHRVGALLPWAESASSWHAYNAHLAAALVAASADDDSVLPAAVDDASGFTPLLLTTCGFDHGALPAPVVGNQAASRVDARLQGLLSVAQAAGRPGLRDVAAFAAAWYFGANAAGSPMYDRTTGRTYDGISASGEINLDSGAESTIHGLLSMLALDATPGVAELAQRLSVVEGGPGVTWIEAESGSLSGGAKVVTPYSAWEGETQWGKRSYLALPGGGRASWTVPASAQPRVIVPVSNVVPGRSRWRAGSHELETVDHSERRVSGAAEAADALFPMPLGRPLPAGATELSVDGLGSADLLRLDGIALIPMVPELRLSGATLLVNLDSGRHEKMLPRRGLVRTYDESGTLRDQRQSSSSATVLPGGFTMVLDRSSDER